MWRNNKKVEISGSFWLLCAFFALIRAPLVLLAVLTAAALHEMGHYAALQSFGVPVEQVRVTAFGAELRFGHAGRMTYAQELLTVLAGPAVNLLCAAVTARLAWNTAWETGYLFAGAHLVLGLFNLLPLLPLDGGRALYLLLSWRLEPVTAARALAVLSIAAALVCVGFGVWLFACAGGGCFFLLGALGLLGAQMGLVKPARRV